MMADLVSEKELLEWTGFSRPADVERLLRNNHIPWLPGKGGKICTTMKAIEQALYVQGKINATQAKD